jgi:hypothetical protein
MRGDGCGWIAGAGPEKVYYAGESCAEVPGDHHAVSANASDTQPARKEETNEQYEVQTHERRNLLADRCKRFFLWE